MALTDVEKEKVRYHLGYPSIRQGSSLHFGMVTPTETGYLIEKLMEDLLPQGEARARRIIQVLDDVEERLIAAQARLAAQRIDEIELRTGAKGESEPDLLEREVMRWAQRLADVFGAPMHSNSARFGGSPATTQGRASGGGTRGINTRVLS